MPPNFKGDASLLFPSSNSTLMELNGGVNASVGQDGSPPRPAEPAAQLQRREGVTGKKDKHSIGYIVRSGIAGGLAGCAAKTVVGPLDRVKILFQASNPQFAKYSGSWFGLISAMREINQQDGVRGLFRGHSATLLRIFPYAGIKFLAYEQIRAVLIPDSSKEVPLRRLLSGSLAGVTSVFFTYPLEIIRVRLAFETKRDSRSSLVRICKQIYHEHPPPPVSSSSAAGSAPVRIAAETLESIKPRSGVVNFYRGFSPTLVGMLPYAGISFLTYDTVGDWLRHPSVAAHTTLPLPEGAAPGTRPRLTNLAELTCGALAGLVSQTASYPLEVIRRRMQVGGAVGDGKMLSMRETAARIWAERGLPGFFVGLGIGYVKIVPMAAISYWVYERSKMLLGI